MCVGWWILMCLDEILETFYFMLGNFSCKEDISLDLTKFLAYGKIWHMHMVNYYWKNAKIQNFDRYFSNIFWPLISNIFWLLFSNIFLPLFFKIYFDRYFSNIFWPLFFSTIFYWYSLKTLMYRILFLFLTNFLDQFVMLSSSGKYSSV